MCQAMLRQQKRLLLLPWTTKSGRHYEIGVASPDKMTRNLRNGKHGGLCYSLRSVDHLKVNDNNNSGGSSSSSAEPHRRDVNVSIEVCKEFSF